MRAITIIPGQANSARIEDVPVPAAGYGSVLVKALELGICGTDFELVSGDYGWSPPGDNYLILGHESLGLVEEAPADSALRKGDLVVGIVRRPDPEPCVACAAGEWDMCRNGKYTERGIKERHGFGSEWWRIEPAFAVKLDPSLKPVGILMEPTSVVAKAWDHITRIGERARWAPRTLLVTGAGPIGLLAALIGSQRGLEVHVLDRVQDGLKPQLVRELGAQYHTGPINGLSFRPDILIECTGVGSLIVESMSAIASDGILCLIGVSSHDQEERIHMGDLSRSLVLDNSAIFGTVNANLRHYQMAEQVLLSADRQWLSRLISRKEPLSNWQSALKRLPGDIKVVIDFTATNPAAGSNS
jgi:threonine dehydrogenase-like Zn-dependent dehydrogenase